MRSSKRPSKRRLAFAATLVLAMLAWDLTRAPDRQVSARIALVTINAYQATLSRVFGAVGARCRFRPTCSHYGETVIRRYGILHGTALAVRRIARCGPWTPLGTYDPPP